MEPKIIVHITDLIENLKKNSNYNYLLKATYATPKLGLFKGNDVDNIKDLINTIDARNVGIDLYNTEHGWTIKATEREIEKLQNYIIYMMFCCGCYLRLAEFLETNTYIHTDYNGFKNTFIFKEDSWCCRSGVIMLIKCQNEYRNNEVDIEINPLSYISFPHGTVSSFKKLACTIKARYIGRSVTRTMSFSWTEKLSEIFETILSLIDDYTFNK